MVSPPKVFSASVPLCAELVDKGKLIFAGYRYIQPSNLLTAVPLSYTIWDKAVPIFVVDKGMYDVVAAAAPSPIELWELSPILQTPLPRDQSTGQEIPPQSHTVLSPGQPLNMPSTRGDENASEELRSPTAVLNSNEHFRPQDSNTNPVEALSNRHGHELEPLPRRSERTALRTKPQTSFFEPMGAVSNARKSLRQRPTPPSSTNPQSSQSKPQATTSKRKRPRRSSQSAESSSKERPNRARVRR